MDEKIDVNLESLHIPVVRDPCFELLGDFRAITDDFVFGVAF